MTVSGLLSAVLAPQSSAALARAAARVTAVDSVRAGPSRSLFDTQDRVELSAEVDHESGASACRLPDCGIDLYA